MNNSPNLDSLKSAWQQKYQAKKTLQAGRSANFQIQQGDRFLSQNKLPEAIACYRRAVKLDFNSTQAQNKFYQAIKQQQLSLGNNSPFAE